MTGGKGNIIGILFGALAFQIVDKIISVLGLNPLINDTIKGAILLLAVILQLINGESIKEMALKIKSWFVPKKKAEALIGESAEVETKTEETSNKEEL